jgi:hypothetical protein
MQMLRGARDMDLAHATEARDSAPVAQRLDTRMAATAVAEREVTAKAEVHGPALQRVLAP